MTTRNSTGRIQDFTQLSKELVRLGTVEAPPSLPPLSRRQFFRLSGFAGGGLVLGLAVGGSRKAVAQDAQAQASEAIEFSPYVQIRPDGRVNIFSKNPECGQGIKTGLPLIIADELDCAWEDVDVLQADIDIERYGTQFAGGSFSTPMNWMAMRQAGATARAMILDAAAQQLNIPREELSTGNTKVRHAATGREWSYGEFAALAATLPVPDPDSLTLKQQGEFTLMGKRISGVDNPDIVRGRPLFGMDTRMPGMVFATFTRCPRIGGVPVSFNEEHITRMPGVLAAFIVEPYGDAKLFDLGSGAHFGGVAIVARNTWAAIKAKRELEVEWDYTNAESSSWSEWVEQAKAIAQQDGPMELKSTGDVAAAFRDAAKVVEAFYEYPYVSHSPLEPENCTALFHGDSIEVWAPSQAPQGAESGLAARLGLPAEKAVVHQTRIGGGFGRKLANDFVYEAAMIASRIPGVPVQLTWTREDDMSFDYFRAGGFHSYKGALDANGRLTAWQDHFITFTADGEQPISFANLDPETFPGDVVPNVKISQTMFNVAIPTGPMRAPGSNALAYVYQSFLHELAVAAGKDHRDFLLETLGEPRFTNPESPQSLHTGRAAGVIRAVTEQAGWGTRTLPPEHALGLAFYFCHAGYVAQVAEVSVNANKQVKVHKVWVAVDIGFIHNRSSAESQMEGSVLDGLSQVFNAKITFENGVIQQRNFHQYPLLRMPQTPELEVVFLEDPNTPPTGAGEPGMPPIVPAITNAIFAATGERIRKLPLSELGYTLV